MRINTQSDLFQLISRESPKDIKRVLAISFFVGITNMGLIALINKAAADVSNGESVSVQFFLFAFLLITFLVITNIANRENIKSTQGLVHRFKMRIMSEIFKSDLAKIDSIGRAEILQILARDTQTVSQSITFLVSGCQSVATLIFLTLYMATISLTAFFIIGISSVLIVFAGVYAVRNVTNDLEVVGKRENALNEMFSDFLNGYKEIKMHSDRAYEISRDMVKEARGSSEAKSKLLIFIANYFNYLQVLMYAVVGLMIFVVPILSTDFSTSVMQATTTSLFLTASLTGIIQSVPSLSQSNAAARELIGLEEKILSKEPQQGFGRREVFSTLESIRIENITYQYANGNGASRTVGSPAMGAQSFSLGPISYEFHAGKVYFVRGNNGSGKTTLIRMLVGLSQPTSGQIYVNEVPIALPATSDYRDLFSVVFTDFHLFKKLYGLHDVTANEIQHLIELFQMEKKVSVTDGIFSNLRFSTGQKKRLALIVALLEKRQVIILDEWAADQDPEFRHLFYEKIIPMLRAMGKTVIAITHDDHYYQSADYLLQMVNGQLVKN
jgi:putative ATP-binding cassette transporter